MASEIMAGDREAAGAILGMQDIYGRPLPERGDHIRGVSGGKAWSGECVHSDQLRVIVEVDDESYITVSPADIQTD